MGYKELRSTRVASGQGLGEQKRESNYEDVSGDEDRRTAMASKGQEVPCRARPVGRARGRVEARGRLTEGD